MEAQHSSQSLTEGEPLPLSKSKSARFPLREESYNLLLCGWHQKPCFPKVYRSPVLKTEPPCRRVTSLLSKTWNSRSSTEWQSAILLVLGGLHPTVDREPALPTVTVGEPMCPNQRVGTQAPSLREEGKKRGNLQYSKNPTSFNISNIPLSEEHCGSSRRKN
jgi:hypothetical protein